MITWTRLCEFLCRRPGWCTSCHRLELTVLRRASRKLHELSSLGHFLKGSSATLGLVKVRDGCEKIQRFGKNENEDGSAEPDSDLCLKRISEALTAVKADYKEVEQTLRRYYEKLESKDDA